MAGTGFAPVACEYESHMLGFYTIPHQGAKTQNRTEAYSLQVSRTTIILNWLIRPVEMNSELIPFPTSNSIIPQLGCFVKSKSKFDSLFPLPLLQRGGGLSIRIYLHSTPSLYLEASLPSSPKREKVAQNCRASYIVWLSVLICPILSQVIPIL